MNFLMIKQETAKTQQWPSRASFLPSLNDETDGTGVEHTTESTIFLFAVHMAFGLLRTNNAPQKICELRVKNMQYLL